MLLMLLTATATATASTAQTRGAAAAAAAAAVTRHYRQAKQQYLKTKHQKQQKSKQNSGIHNQAKSTKNNRRAKLSRLRTAHPRIACPVESNPVVRGLCNCGHRSFVTRSSPWWLLLLLLLLLAGVEVGNSKKTWADWSGLKTQSLQQHRQ